MTELTLTVPDIHCGHCKSSIEGAVAEVAGVERVEVAIDTHTVGVAFGDPAVLSDIVAAIEEQGYEVGE